VSLKDYKANLGKEIAILKKTGAKLIWCSTTPVQSTTKSQYARQKGASEIFNKAALEVMAKHPDIQINDLHGLITDSPAFDPWRKTTDVHFYKDEERQALGKAVAVAVKKALEKPSKKLPLPGETFSVNGRTAFLILPETRPAGKPTPWVWYAPTLPRLPSNAEKWMFEKLLEKGIAIAGIDVGESMGSPAGVADYAALHEELVTKHGMSKTPSLLARSRGGLMLYNWAVTHPDSVSAVAGIYPVGNLASYPGLGRAAPAYGITKHELAKRLAEFNPVDRLAPLAKAKVPIMHLHGDSDKIVPIEMNSGLVKEHYEKLGGEMKLEIIPGGGHDMNPHWFRSQALVDFLIKHAK
jgi:pimeloyl-ACP methyl ester carboxylesterase